MVFEEHVPLRDHTTLHVGGEARYFCRAGSAADIRDAYSFARERMLPVAVLGGGSNVLPQMGEFPGLVVKVELRGIEWRDDGELVFARVQAGEEWDRFVAEAVGRGLWGIENLSGIPGSVGAAPIQNIGAYGMEAKDTIESVEAFDTAAMRDVSFHADECRFGYRESFFKMPEGRRFIVTAVTFRLSRRPDPKLSYKDLREYFMGRSSPSLPDIRGAVLAVRGRKFPPRGTVGTAGSFFKNPHLPADAFAKLRRRYPKLPGYPAADGSVKVPLAWILDKVLNLKGYRRGGVSLYENQPLVLVNDGSANVADIESFAKDVASRVRDATGIEIEWEVQRLRS